MPQSTDVDRFTDMRWITAFLCLFLLAAPAAAYGAGDAGQMSGQSTEAWYTWPVDPGPSWNVPRISLPEGIGLLEGYESEWWYYVGTVLDNSGESYSLQLQAIRYALLPGDLETQAVAGTVGIGIRSEGTYLWSTGYGAGVARQPGGPAALVVPPVRDDAFEVLLQAWTAGSAAGVARPAPSWRFTYAGGDRVGMPGALYRISAQGTGDLRGASSADSIATDYAMDILVKDVRGMVLEGSSGYVGPGPDNPEGGAATYEFAQPILEVVEGNISIGGRVRDISQGKLWLDRQVLTTPKPLQSGLQATASGHAADRFRSGVMRKGARAGGPLYLGTWMAIVLDDGTSADLATFWQPHDRQWLTGSMVGRPPLDYLGNIYLPVHDKMENGGLYLRHGAYPGEPDFDVNVLRPRFGPGSPHWRSPVSNQTYATAWQVKFASRLSGMMPRRIYIAALVDPCENLLPDASNAFWEGAAIVYRDPGLRHPIGRAFVEQMGFLR